jgi:hypothetical protein
MGGYYLQPVVQIFMPVLDTQLNCAIDKPRTFITFLYGRKRFLQPQKPSATKLRTERTASLQTF